MEDILTLVHEIRRLWKETDGDCTIIEDEQLERLLKAAEAGAAVPRLVQELLPYREVASPDRRASINKALQTVWNWEPVQEVVDAY